MVDADNIDSMEQARLKLDSIFPVMTPAEQIESVIGQVREGFEKIATINAEAEKEQVDEAQEEQDDQIEEVMDEAKDEAADIIEEEDDASDAADEVEEVMEDAADEILERITNTLDSLPEGKHANWVVSNSIHDYYST